MHVPGQDLQADKARRRWLEQASSHFTEENARAMVARRIFFGKCRASSYHFLASYAIQRLYIIICTIKHYSHGEVYG